MMDKKKIDTAIRLLQTTCGEQEVELCYSGGKDSDVILELAKMAGIKYRAIYKNSVSYLGHLIRYSLSVQTKSDAIMEVIFSHSQPRIDKLRWFVDVCDFDGGISHFPCRYIHQYQNILTALELKSLNFGDFYPYEVEESETK